ncbi:hypothetical protein [Dongia sp.]|uniref:hypothetical protein n=1 Tax=Dongia sp. TaxID=1977262 RepID=UPI0035B132E5
MTVKDARKSLERLAQQQSRAAIAALAAVMADESAPPAARITAANTLLQWGFGKPNAGQKEDAPAEKSEQIVRLCWGNE